MPLNYKYDSKLNIVYLFPEGEITLPEIEEHHRELIDDKEISEGFVEMVYLDNVTKFHFSSKSSSAILTSYKELIKSKGVKAIVCVAGNDLQYGIGRMLQITFEMELPQLITHVVRSKKKAHEILENITG